MEEVILPQAAEPSRYCDSDQSQTAGGTIEILRFRLVTGSGQVSEGKDRHSRLKGT